MLKQKMQINWINKLWLCLLAMSRKRINCECVYVWVSANINFYTRHCGLTTWKLYDVFFSYSDFFHGSFVTLIYAKNYFDFKSVNINKHANIIYSQGSHQYSYKIMFSFTINYAYT